MKVKVAKSIDFEEVPKFVASNVEHAEEDLQTCVANIKALSVVLREEDVEPVSLRLIEKIRQKIIDIDLVLQDSNDILLGYMQVLLQQKEDELENEVKKTISNAEEYIEKTSQLTDELESESDEK